MAPTQTKPDSHAKKELASNNFHLDCAIGPNFEAKTNW
jgi:hypothetical protein